MVIPRNEKETVLFFAGESNQGTWVKIEALYCNPSNISLIPRNELKKNKQPGEFEVLLRTLTNVKGRGVDLKFWNRSTEKINLQTAANCCNFLSNFYNNFNFLRFVSCDSWWWRNPNTQLNMNMFSFYFIYTSTLLHYSSYSLSIIDY